MYEIQEGQQIVLGMAIGQDDLREALKISCVWLILNALNDIY